ncbi:Tryptophan transporter TrpP [Desulfonispora thiosulfatigenes DSM 11270]|uniref:Tryptophan transporter TrpP n=1 Tax=Desulfonispora thiosulfatigenes DSM 11270 TaxID=656914 RepID=A0A1W1VSZ9_DESTI|nr:tryptophan transporter [Desulfonispora thiosulfatigenes]SMB96456.1 Tryptophan transporter TrpP [Desulfonispora thiosulfatigenes DSM 11270]
MKIKEIVQVSLLLGIGMILHLIIPGYGAGMKPDLLLSMLFIIIFMKKDFKLSMLAGVVAGLLCMLTTQFPGGQLPNLIDKIATAFLVYILVKLFFGRIPDLIGIGIIGAIGTLFSGSVFLITALALVGIPAPFGILFTTVVVPATILNTIGIVILYPIVRFSSGIVEKSKPIDVLKKA